jgi:hypothetical protein
MSFFDKFSKFAERFPWLACPLLWLTVVPLTLALGAPIVAGVMVFAVVKMALML